MNPAQAQQHVLDALEQLGGKPVLLREDPGQANPARIHIASAAEPVHVLTYNRAALPELPYFVAFQCGLAERALKAAPDERFNVASSISTYKQIEQLVREKKTLPENAVKTYSTMITDGLGTQLRSMPIGLRVDRAIYRKHPELREMQRVAAERSMKENVSCLHPSVRQLAPDLVLTANSGMNAAFALGWSELWGEKDHVIPYNLAGYEELGKTLVDLLDRIPDSPTHDRELVNGWATTLKLDRLFVIGPVGL